MPSRGGSSFRGFHHEPKARRVDAVCPAYSIAQREKSVDDFRAEGRALFQSQVSRKTKGGFRLVYDPKGCVGRCREIKNLVSDRVGESGLVVPEGVYPCI